ncbi:hypothetical protein C884_00366 [Kocuria palustris PEL]|uniref:Uncharacterized protein n=1 Tax=Kocuria palustris PEL TaxID=1236550 RepID=M2XUM9_9MICC|nr:hypothetical protein C884_00366 [Kocuria palustris PEL]
MSHAPHTTPEHRRRMRRSPSRPRTIGSRACNKTLRPLTIWPCAWARP